MNRKVDSPHEGRCMSRMTAKKNIVVGMIRVGVGLTLFLVPFLLGLGVLAAEVLAMYGYHRYEKGEVMTMEVR